MKQAIQNTQLEYSDLWKDTCVFCTGKIKTYRNEELRNHTVSHFYDKDIEQRLHITHQPAENIIGFKLELNTESKNNIADYITNTSALMKNNFLKEENIKKVMINIRRHLESKLPDIKYNEKILTLKGYSSEIASTIEEIIQDHARDYESESIIVLDKLLFNIKEYHNLNQEWGEHHEEKYLPNSIKSHLRCWPFSNNLHEEIEYKKFYSKIQQIQPILAKESQKYPELQELLMNSKVKILTNIETS
jgi:hypothetical protein